MKVIELLKSKEWSGKVIDCVLRFALSFALALAQVFGGYAPLALGMIGASKTVGVFQLESAGMKNFMKELKPQSLEDIIAGISLYRPGPMDFIPRYIKGKNNPDTITYECPELEPILEPTYGCIVYQEQVMQIVRELAGYTLGRSDLVRRAMSKKKASVMAKERQNFVYGNEEEGVPGCIHRGISEKTANKILYLFFVMTYKSILYIKY